jgi:hypothetical protein
MRLTVNDVERAQADQHRPVGQMIGELDSSGIEHGPVRVLESFGLAFLAFFDPDGIALEFTSPIALTTSGRFDVVDLCPCLSAVITVDRQSQAPTSRRKGRRPQTRRPASRRGTPDLGPCGSAWPNSTSR